MDEKKEKISKAAVSIISIPFLITNIICLLISVFVLIICSGSLYHNYILSYVETDATIIEIKKDRDTLYTPVYEYEANGQTITIDGIPYAKEEEAKIGDKVHILYNPKKPTQYDVGSKNNVLPIAIPMLITFFITTTNLYSFIKSMKTKWNFQ